MFIQRLVGTHCVCCSVHNFKMWQLTMYCHWRPPDAMPLLTYNVFCGLGHQRPNFDGYICIHLFGSHQRHLFPPIWQRLVGFGFRVQRVGSTMQNLWRVGENSDPVLSRLWTKVHNIFRWCRKPLYFPTPFSDCLCHVLFRRYSPLSLEVVEKRSKCKSFLRQYAMSVGLITSAKHMKDFTLIWFVISRIMEKTLYVKRCQIKVTLMGRFLSIVGFISRMAKWQPFLPCEVC